MSVSPILAHAGVVAVGHLSAYAGRTGSDWINSYGAARRRHPSLPDSLAGRAAWKGMVAALREAGVAASAGEETMGRGLLAVSNDARDARDDVSVDLGAVAGTGRDGRVTKEDVLTYMSGAAPAAAAAATSAAAAPVAPAAAPAAPLPAAT